MRFKKAKSINWHFVIVYILDRISFSYIQLIDFKFCFSEDHMMCYVSYLKTFKSFMMKYTNWFSRPVLDLQHIKKIRWLAVTVLCSMFGMHVCSTVGHIQTCFSHLIFLTSPFKRRKQGYIDNITCKNMERQISLLLFVSFLIKLLFFNWIFF